MTYEKVLLAMFKYGTLISPHFIDIPCGLCKTDKTDDELKQELSDFILGKTDSSEEINQMIDSLNILERSVKDHIYLIHSANHLNLFSKRDLRKPDVYNEAHAHAIHFYELLKDTAGERVEGRNIITEDIKPLHIFPFQIYNEGKIVSAHMNQVLEIINQNSVIDRKYIETTKRYLTKIEEIFQ